MEVIFIFVRREKNQVMDILAKKSRKLDENVNIVRELPYPPNYCNNILVIDCNRLFKPKIIMKPHF